MTLTISLIPEDGNEIFLTGPQAHVNLVLGDALTSLYTLTPVRYATLRLASRDGEVVDTATADARVVDLPFYIRARSHEDILDAIRGLHGTVRHGKRDGNKVIIKVTNGTKTAYLDTYYYGEAWSVEPGANRRVVLRLIAYDPYWYTDEVGSITSDGAYQTDGSIIFPYELLPGPGAWTVVGANGRIRAIEYSIYDDCLYVGGDFTSIGGVQASYLARWDGTNWTAFGSPNGPVYAIEEHWLSPSLNWIWVGGAFTSIGGIEAKHIANTDRTAWYEGGDGVDDVVRTIAASLTNIDLYVGGDFTTAWQNSGDPVTVNHIARYYANWYTLGSGTNAPVYDIVPAQDGSIYVGGTFTTAGGAPANYVARWDGTNWTALGNGLNAAIDKSQRLAIGSDGKIYTCVCIEEDGGYYAQAWNGVAWIRLPYRFAIEPLHVFALKNKIYFSGHVYDGYSVLPLDNNLSYSYTNASIGQYRDYVVFGLIGNVQVTCGKISVVTVDTDAEVLPVITFPAYIRVESISNYTTGKTIYLNADSYLVDRAEYITIDCEKLSVTSNLRGDVSWLIEPHSDFDRFSFVPGENIVSVFSHIPGPDDVSITWRKRYNSLARALS